MSDLENPLLSPSPLAWQQLIEAVDPASLLLVIERRMSALLRSEYSSEDVLQEALLHAWRSRAQCEWRGIKSFRSWLLTIIDRRIHDLADRLAAEKRAGGRHALSLSANGSGNTTTTSAGQDLPAGSTTPSRLAMYREQADAMTQALAELPEDLREVVRLRLFEQCPLEEIAVRSNLGVSAVRHRFRKGSEIYLRRLQAVLGSRSGSGAARSRSDCTADPAAESSPQEEPLIGP